MKNEYHQKIKGKSTLEGGWGIFVLFLKINLNLPNTRTIPLPNSFCE